MDNSDAFQPPMMSPQDDVAFAGLGIATQPRFLVSTLAALGAAASSAAIWVLLVTQTGYQLGFAALGVGWLTGVAAVMASKGATDRRLQLMSVAATLVALAGAEYFIVRAMFIESIGGATGIPLLLPLSDMVAVVNESISADPVTLLFWGIGAYAAFKIARPRSSF